MMVIMSMEEYLKLVHKDCNNPADYSKFKNLLKDVYRRANLIMSDTNDSENVSILLWRIIFCKQHLS